MINKGSYLKELTAAMMPFSSVPVGPDLSGTSPPSIFIGQWNYPDVLAGPMVTPVHGNTAEMDMPEAWIAGRRTQEEIIRYRLGLVRGTRRVNVSGLDNHYVEKLQEVALSSASVESEAGFARCPQGFFFSEEHAPHGPSAPLDRFEISAGTWQRDLEKVFYDTDLPAKEAILNLHAEHVPFSSIQKALSAGTMGKGRNRHLVPTRWSITACDTAIGDNLLYRVKQCTPIDTVRVHEFSSLNNHYAVILLPTAWQYEWTEAFLHVLGSEEYVFSDCEGHKKKAGYSSLGGCYYSCKMAVLEALAKEQKQAGAIVLREAVQGYVPLGVFNVRENVRHAMQQKGQEFEDIGSALSSLAVRFTLPMQRFIDEGSLLRQVTRGGRQSTLASFYI
ncbi:MAG: hypothetical protein A4E35_02263 [Methanoregula sp. PtaU1.Bin051]|nr:MAG: hypothetical protein A4E35_02263 [Methanoregula sp. PtaU1.Bin051]